MEKIGFKNAQSAVTRHQHAYVAIPTIGRNRIAANHAILAPTVIGWLWRLRKAATIKINQIAARPQ